MASQNVPLTPTFTASATNISRESLDCGLKAIGWCRGEKCQNLARLRYFLPIFLIIGILHGASQTYFRISTKQTTSTDDNNPELIDWLLVSSYIFQALLALIIGFWSQHFHPIGWLGGLTIFQSIFYFISIIPTLTHYDFDITSSVNDNFTSTCKNSIMDSIVKEDPIDYNINKIIMLFLLQFGIALGYTAFYTIGLPYIDDNVNVEDTPIILGASIAAHVFGTLFGSAITFIASATHLNWWFGWAIIGPLLFLMGTLIALFPRKLVRTVLKEAAQRIIDGTSLNPTRTRTFRFIDDMNFIPSLKRLLTNKILLLNLLGLTFIKIGIINYELNEQYYLQSRYYFPTDESNGIMDEWMSRFLTYLLKPPIIGTCILLTGIIISKVKPNTRSISIFNIICGVLIALIFVSYIFIDCTGSKKLAGVRKGVVIQPYCSKDCICSITDNRILFSPVCPEKSNLTYFSPCHAGCKNKVALNDITIYENCTCGLNPHQSSINFKRATQGACNMKECQTKWIVFQILVVIVAALFGSMIICKLMITIRSVLDQDKSLALSLDLVLCGTFVYVFGKLIYDTVADNTCAFWSTNYKKCLLQDSSLYGNLLNFITIGFIIIGIILEVILFIFSDDLDLFSRSSQYEEPYHFTPPLLQVPPAEQNVSVTNNNNNGNSNNNNNNNNGNNNNNKNNSTNKTPENKPFLKPIKNKIQKQQQPSQFFSSLSTDSDSEISPKNSPYRRKRIIPKVENQAQTSETDF